jgi:hypothetical protein
VNKNHENPLVVGLSLGLFAGFLESVSLLAHVAHIDEVSGYPLLALATWGLLGISCGCAVQIRQVTTRSAPNLRGLPTARIALLLMVIATAGELNGNLLHSPATNRIAVNLALVGAALVVWLAIPWIVRPPRLLELFSAISRSAALLAFLSTVAVALLTVLGHQERTINIERFVPPQPPPVTDHKSAPQVMVLGIDAATWDIALPLVERGELPNLRALMRRGHWGILRSYDVSFSPVVWTSIMTGKDPEEHGVSYYALERRVKPIWQIAQESGRRCAVVNVPGSYPLQGDCELMFAGFPMPARASLGNFGWLATTKGAKPAAKGPVPIRLDFDPRELKGDSKVGAQIVLRDLPVAIPLRESAPFLLLRALTGDGLMTRLFRSLGSLDFGRLELQMSRDLETGQITVEGKSDQPLFRLTGSQWSEWLVTTLHDERFAFRVRSIASRDDGVSLYITPLFSLSDAKTVAPLDRLNPLLSKPYIGEAAGWLLFLDDRLLDPLYEHILDSAETRFEAGRTVLDHFDLDLFVYVFTETDRMQHAMLKFMQPEAYLDLARQRGGDYEHYKPTPEQIARLGDAIPSTYRAVDRWIGEFLKRAGPKTTVVIASDHGAQAGVHHKRPTGGIHHPDGIYVVAPALEKREAPNSEPLAASRGPDLTLEAITPIVLDLLGMPVALDMRTALPEFVQQLAAPVARIPTYEGEESNTPTDVGVDPALQEQLKSLGYAE